MEMMFHVYSDFTPKDDESRRRMEVAKSTWEKQSWREIPIKDANVPRVFNEPNRQLPFLKEIFKEAVWTREDHDIMVFTNSDICVASNCSDRIRDHLQERNACYAFRNDFPKVNRVIPDDLIVSGHHYCGADLFAFRVSWWREHGAKFPDMVLGREAWDACMRVLMEATNPKKPLSLPNLIYHEKHPNGWEAPIVRYSLPGQIHNLRLAYAWLPTMNQNPSWFGVKKV